MHILSPETYNCPSWISGRERIIIKNISWSISMKNVAGPSRDQSSGLLITSQTRIWLSYQGRLKSLFFLTKLYQCFSYFSINTYRTGTHLMRFPKVLLISTYNVCFHREKYLSGYLYLSWAKNSRKLSGLVRFGTFFFSRETNNFWLPVCFSTRQIPSDKGIYSKRK